MAQQALVTQDALAAFFGAFNASVGALCVATQFLLTAGVLRRFGLGPVLFLLPDRPPPRVGGAPRLRHPRRRRPPARASDKVLRYSIDRPAVELLYLPVPPGLKLPAKSFIDTVAWRAGDGLAGLAVLAFATARRAGPRSPRPRDPAVHRPVARPGLAGAPALRGDAAARACSQHRLDAERATPVALDRDTTEVIAARLDAVDPKRDPLRPRPDGRGPPGGRHPPRGARPARPRGPRGAAVGPSAS